MRGVLAVGVVLVILLVGVEIAGDSKKPSTVSSPRYSTSQASSVWVVVNKKHPLRPANYAPAGLITPHVTLRNNITTDERLVSPKAAKPLETLFNAAARNHIQLNLQSGYRSYDFQVRLYKSYVSEQGAETADKYSAKPGFSEHQTGLAVDFGGASNPACDVTDCFAETTEAAWLKNNAYRYGFILRYPQDKQGITGYSYEPWHYRYVGTDLAKKIHQKNNPTLEEYFKIP